MSSEQYIIHELHSKLLGFFVVVFLILSGSNLLGTVTQNPHTVRLKDFGIFLLSFWRWECGKIKKIFSICTCLWLLQKVAFKFIDFTFSRKTSCCKRVTCKEDKTNYLWHKKYGKSNRWFNSAKDAVNYIPKIISFCQK